MKCPYCGAESRDRICEFCGSEIPGFTPSAEQQPAEQTIETYEGEPVYEENVQSYVDPVPVTGLWILAVVTLLFNTIFGILSIINVSGINKAKSLEEQQKKIKNAKLFAIIGLVLGAIYLLMTFMGAV